MNGFFEQHSSSFIFALTSTGNNYMTLTDAAIKILNQLGELLDQLEPSEFTRPSELLNGSTIGEHVRHTLEFFSCLESGRMNGIVNYDKRDHNCVISSDKGLAAALVARMIVFVGTLTEDRELTLQVAYDASSNRYQKVNTNSFRELVYNIEHAVHHLAIIKIAVREIVPHLTLAKDFGIAASTVRYTLAPKVISDH